MSRFSLAIVMSMTLVLAACAWDDDVYTVGGSISGLTSSGLVLANGSDTRSVDAGATSFTLPTARPTGSNYNIVVLSSPVSQTCSVANGSGSMGTTNVTSVVVACGPNTFTLGGSISGLTTSGLVLANGSDTLAVNAPAGTFTFSTALASGTEFDITVVAQPEGLTCSVANGSGVVGTSNLTSVAVTCSANTFTLGGSISGLTTSGLVLANGGDTLAVEAGASQFTFPALVATGRSFNVTVQSQPAGQTCSVASGSGVVGNANLNNTVVTCNVSAFTVGGSISGLTMSGLVLANGGDTLVVEAGTSSVTFPALMALGGSFNVTVKSQPVGQTCSVAGGSGIMNAANVTSVTITCGLRTFTLGGTVSGLISSGLVLANGDDALTVAANDSHFTLPTRVDFGSSFDVTVQAQPSGLTCTVANGSGTMDAANVTNVAITCGLRTFTLGGSVSGLTSSGLVLVNGSDTLIVAANDNSFTLPTPVVSGSSFNVTVQTQPSGLTCTVFNGAGTVDATNVTNVAITCSPAAFTLGGSISGLTSSGLVLANGSDTLSVAANASVFSMPTAVAVGSPFEVTVRTQADEDTCGVSNGSGIMGSADVSSVSITCQPVTTYTVSTFAGSGTPGSTNGSSTTASFDGPNAVAVDRSGNVYVADGEGRKIRKITPAGEVSTFAGSGATGGADGTGTAASFSYPNGIAVDGSGNLYVTDGGNHNIRKITSQGVVTTFAGSGTADSVDGTGTAASFSYPNGIAFDVSGNLYVADGGGRKIRKITPARVVTTFAGSGAFGSADGMAPVASFRKPSGIAVDGSGNLYVTDSANHNIRKITSEGVVTTLAGTGDPGSEDGSATTATFNEPAGIAVDGSGTVYVADRYNGKIRKITSEDVVSTLAGSGTQGSTDGPGMEASFRLPLGVAIDRSGTLYVADCVNSKIRQITRD